MAIKPAHTQGFSLLIAIIFMAVMLALGTALATMGYKETLLSSTAVQSQYAFYAADAGLECALLADKSGAFEYPVLTGGSTLPNIECDGVYETPVLQTNSTYAKFFQRIDIASGKECADITLYKYADPANAPGHYDSFLFAQGYNAPCSTVDQGGTTIIARGLYAKY
jgi:hypothetical protein